MASSRAEVQVRGPLDTIAVNHLLDRIAAAAGGRRQAAGGRRQAAMYERPALDA